MGGPEESVHQHDDAPREAQSNALGPEQVTPASQPPDPFWARIKRHKVVEWTLAYVAFGYALLHGIQMLREAFDWPLTVSRLTAVGLVLGAPVAVTLAWYHGHRARHRVSGQELSILIALLVVAGSVLWWASRTGGTTHADSTVAGDAMHSNPALSEKSIALLPFVDMSEKRDQEYFADGMAEEILNVLAKIPGLQVIGRTSSFQFKGKNEDLRKIGIELGAAHLVQGSLRRSGDHIRINAQLIRSTDGLQEWSGSYERQVGDVLKMQQEIAVSLARALQLTVKEKSVSRSETHNPEAYDLFLRGLHAFDQFDKGGLEEAANNFQQALALEPSFIRAAESLALTHFVQADNTYVPAANGFERARTDAKRLILMNPRSEMGHAILARIYTDYDWGWDAAQREAAEALAIAPRSVVGHYAAAAAENVLGQWDEAERHERAALSADPLYSDMHQLLGATLYGKGRFAEAETEYRRALQISPSYDYVHFQLTADLLALAQPDVALREIQLDSLDSDRLSGLAVVYHALGRKADSDSALRQLTQQNANSNPYQIALAHAYRGETDQAFDWLDRAYSQRDFELTLVKGEWLLKSVRGDPRYKAFLRKMNLPE